MDRLLIIIIILDIFLISILAFVLLLPALIVIVKMKKYEKVEGEITDKEDNVIQTTDGGARVAHYKYSFVYNGRSYKIEDKAYNHNRKLNIGDKVTIYIKPNNPDTYLYPEFVSNRYFNIFISLLGIIPLLFLLTLVYKI